ncbi:M14 family metallopeptidase [Xanthocytophaga flava]|uniref:M14 family metallopeptidase n=1 Tax=Xanthocytophaga flava TaxID=3048013 RepID=UPI0028D2D497|nr:M14 family metallopeptidase [Xanthocytophaga flavus]MDJ1467403.1 M14 family metallopeptidase [Xanthocytophaga flavus]
MKKRDYLLYSQNNILNLWENTYLCVVKNKLCGFFFFQLCVILLSFHPATAQNVPTPEKFLGYKLGDQFTPHDRLVRYFETIASQATDRCKLVPYGQTYEGRPLMVMVVATPENINRLEEIRTNNLKITGLVSGTPSSVQPAIVWLSYNVHGNEAVSSEAVMQVLYDLVNPANAEMQGWLKNMVVLLDPCLNPDGHERYVQWYKQVANFPYQPLPFSREHQEPWPGGRFNHYLFDLNRDWAWQTQQETQQRVALYNQWMPHLHADFHEMGPESPYYFAPSAKPYHEALTPWQRQFQQHIGEANRKYFDKNYWLYFTREKYDLLYPSFGDTWPSFNGAIGMTYEQGGSGRAGLGYLTSEGDTLTLTKRIAHHVAASYASIEAVASRGDQVLKEFKTYFDQSRNNPQGAYKGYLIKAKGDESKIQSIAQLLDRNGIRYGYANKGGSVKGFNYATGKSEAAKIEENDLVISAYQPKSVMLRALFDPKPMLEDSLTYDLTSWAIPYAFGVKAYGLSDAIASGNTSDKPKNTTSAQSPVVVKPYAYLVEWKDLRDVQFLSALLKKKIKIRNSEVAFEMNGKTFAPGTLLITRTGNEALGEAFDTFITDQAKLAGIIPTPVSTGFVDKGFDFGSDYNHFIKAPRIGLVTGSGISTDGFSSTWHFFEQQIHYPISVIDVSRLGSVPLQQLDILILPSGSYSGVWNERMINKLKEWIQDGGKVIAIENAAEILGEKTDFEWKKKEEAKPAPKKVNSPADTLKIYGHRDREYIAEDIQGSVYQVTLDNTHPLAFGYEKNIAILFRNNSPYELMKKGWNVGYLQTTNYTAGHVGYKTKAKLQNSAIFGVQEMGRGQIIYMAENPIFRAFWHGGKLLFGNAVFMVGQAY